MLLIISIMAAWLSATLFVFALIKKRLKIVPFTPIRYLGLMSFMPVGMILSWRGGNDKVWVVFLVGACVGMAGVTLISFIWDFLIDKKFWIYRNGRILHGYTSIYNIIPWGCFALMVNLLLDEFIVKQVIIIGRIGGFALWQFFLFLWLGGLCLAVMGRMFWLVGQGKSFNLNEKFSWKLYCLYTVPILIAIGGVSILGDVVLLLYALVVMALGYIIEYIYGLLLHWVFIEKDITSRILWRFLHVRKGFKAWEYQYAKWDGGITSLTNLPYWALGAFYFAFILSYL